MSDELKTPESDDNRLATEGEVASLAETFQQSMKQGVSPYVAPPAPGYDTDGIWHCFGAGHRSGYATHAIALHWVLDRVLGIPTQLIPNRVMDIDIDDFPADRSEMLLDWTKSAVGRPHLAFSSFPPDSSAVLDGLGPPIVPYIAFEGTTVSQFTVDLINGEAFEKVWVVHDFVAEALIASGVATEKVHVAPPMLFGGPWEGLHKSLGDRSASAWSQTSIEEQPFRFGVMGTWHERKGFVDLVRAYWSEFARDEPVELHIRTSAFGKKMTIKEFGEEITHQLAAVAAELGDDDFPRSKQQARIKITLGTDASDQEVIEWLGDLDCYVSPSYGEGLGIPHLWAKGQGVPLISTEFGAVGETLADIRSRGGEEDSLMDYELVPVHPEMLKFSLMFDKDTRWGGYSIGSLAMALREQYRKGSRRTDILGGEVVREIHSEKAARSAVAEGLAQILSSEHLKLWL